MKKALVVCLLTLRGGVGTQPQRDMRRLHRLPDHPYQVVAQRVEVGLVSKLGGEGFESLSSVVLAAVEAPVYSEVLKKAGLCYQATGEPPAVG